MRKFFCTITILILASLALTVESNASMQSRPDVSSSKSITASDFFKYIRQMETSSGPMGLTATVDSTGTETSSSNNIDVHMIKNTEWGTAAMLSASSFGSAPSGKSSASTTGNATGIYEMADGTYEYVAGMWDKKNSYNTNIYNSASKYWNKYTSATSIPGDATLETKNWKNASDANFVSSSGPVFHRSSSALFGYSHNNGNGDSNGSSRAAVVCGSDF